MRAFLVIVIVFMNHAAIAETNAKSCSETAQTQAEMNQCAGSDFKAADAELNRVYKKMQATYNDDPVFLARLREAQRAWILYRDTGLAMVYPPHDEDPNYYGSIGTMCEAMYLEKITRERIATLNQWLEEAAEGDVCSGSVESVHRLDEPNKEVK